MNRNGLVLALAYVFVGVIWQVLFYSAIATWIQQSGVPGPVPSLPTVELPLIVSASGAVITLLTLQYLTIVAIRTFVSGHSQTIPPEYYTRNIAAVLVNAIIGSIVFGLIVLAGSVLFVIPGIIAYVAFIFILIYIAVEDQNFITALRSSWGVTRGNWLRLFLLLLIVFVVVSLIPGILSAVTRLVVAAVSGPAAGALISGTLTLPFSLLVLGILAEAFTQLRDPQEAN